MISTRIPDFAGRAPSNRHGHGWSVYRRGRRCVRVRVRVREATRVSDMYGTVHSPEDA